MSKSSAQWQKYSASCRTCLPGARRSRCCALPSGPRCTSSCRIRRITGAHLEELGFYPHYPLTHAYLQHPSPRQLPHSKNRSPSSPLSIYLPHIWPDGDHHTRDPLSFRLGSSSISHCFTSLSQNSPPSHVQSAVLILPPSPVWKHNFAQPVDPGCHPFVIRREVPPPA